MIRAAMRAASIPDGVREEIERRYRSLREPPVAVRSSALGEDSHEATFAGQQESYLWVRGAEAVRDAGPRLLGESVHARGDQLSRQARVDG